MNIQALRRVVALIAFPVLVLSSGCATVVSSGSSTIHTLELDAPRSNGKVFTLFDGSRQPVARAAGRDGRIRFELPTDRFIGQCVSVVDDAGKLLLGERKAIHLALRAEHQDAWRQRQTIVSQSSADASAERQARDRLESMTSRLRSNRAFAADGCTRPPQQPIPPRPVARCGSHEECQQDGAAICFTRYLGAKGCGMAASEIRIPGLLSSPGCAAAAAKLAGDKYDLGDAFVDALHGIAADAARQLWKSDSVGDNILAVVIAAGSELMQLNEARTCTNNFVERQFGPLRSWAARAEQIVAEPQQLLGACQRDLADASEQARHTAAAAARAGESRARVDAIDARLAKLAQERRPIAWCTG